MHEKHAMVQHTDSSWIDTARYDIRAGMDGFIRHDGAFFFHYVEKRAMAWKNTGFYSFFHTIGIEFGVVARFFRSEKHRRRFDYHLFDVVGDFNDHFHVSSFFKTGILVVSAIFFMDNVRCLFERGFLFIESLTFYWQAVASEYHFNQGKL